MAQGFDPYHKWLGIPPEEQPANHYRLLAVQLFEHDPDVIEAAADQRMAHLRTYQAGPYSALSQKLLNEVATAKICLLNARKRAQYDATLPKIAPAPSAVEPPTPEPPRPVFDLERLVGESSPAVRPAATSAPYAGAAASRARRDRPATNEPALVAGLWPAKQVAIVGGLILIGLLSGGIFVLWNSNGTQGSPSPASDAVEPASAQRPAAQPAPAVTDKTQGAAADPELVEALRAYTPSAPTVPAWNGSLAEQLVLGMHFKREAIDQRDGKIFVPDFSGAGNHGVARGAKLTDDARFGGALEFDGGPLLVARGLLDKQPQFTVAAWIWPGDAAGDAWWFNEAGAKPVFGIAARQVVAVQGWNRNRSGDHMHWEVKPLVVPRGQWSFIAVRRKPADAASPDQGLLSVTLNDRSYIVTRTFPLVEDSGPTFTTVGQGRGFRLGELAVFQRYLSDEEIRALSSRTTSGPPPPAPNVATAPVQDVTPPTPDLAPAAPVQPVTPAPVASKPAERPGPPLLLEPEPGASMPTNSRLPRWTFQWTPVPGAEYYEFWASDASSTQPLIHFPKASTPIFYWTFNSILPEPLRHGWHWKVRAWVDGRWTDWSQQRNFEVVAGGSGGAPKPAGSEPAAPAQVSGNSLKQKADSVSAALRQSSHLHAPSPETVDAVLPVMVELATADQYDAAIELGTLARNKIRKPADPTVLKRIAAAIRMIGERKVEYAKTESARATLKTDPDDPTANALVGRFLCIYKGDWDAGLPMLARANGNPLKEIAGQDVANPADIGARVKLADAWFDRATAEPVLSAKQAFLGRAKTWYNRALPDLGGLERARAEKRIEQINRGMQ